MRVVFPSDGSEFAPLPSPLGEQGRRSDRARVFRVRVRVSRACACTISIADNGTAALFETSSFRAIDSRPSDSNRRRGQREREEKEKNTNAKFTRRWRVRFCCDSVTHYSRVSFFLFFQPNLTNSSMFDRTNNKRTKRERERYSSFIFFSVVFPPCRRTVGNLHANKEQRGVTGYKTVAIRIYLSSLPLPNTLSKSLRKRSRCLRKRRLILIFESSCFSFIFRLKLRNRCPLFSIDLRPSNWTSFTFLSRLSSPAYI